jgi:hypothetical protein
MIKFGFQLLIVLYFSYYFQPSILTICPNPTMLAQQLTHIELERLSHIGPEEFVQVSSHLLISSSSPNYYSPVSRNMHCTWLI